MTAVLQVSNRLGGKGEFLFAHVSAVVVLRSVSACLLANLKPRVWACGKKQTAES
jgi:hypothetical protein